MEAGDNGYLIKKSGKRVENITFLVLEYIPSGTLFTFCERHGSLGESIGRLFLHKMVEALGHMHDRGIVHRDLKLENVLLTSDFGIKLADFGFAKKLNVSAGPGDKNGQPTGSQACLLRSKKGTMTYMAPEIKLGRKYDGKQVDIFYLGVVLFIIVVGIFPFQQARTDDYFYKMLLNGQTQKYWSKLDPENKLSVEFKSLMESIFSYDGDKRPTLSQIVNGPWLKDSSFSLKEAEKELQNRCAFEENFRSNSTSTSD